MKELFGEKKDCFGCGACYAVCPSGAISMRMDEEGFYYPILDSDRCVGCDACVSVCPAKEPVPQTSGRFYAVRCRDEGLLRNSTSGGAFSLLANHVLKSGGTVCGAVFDDSFRVVHRLSKDIGPMRKSKYVQSDICDCFAIMERTMAEGEKVLFAGTPCQCHAVTCYFSGRTERLLVVSLVCRGVQSPGLWAEYIRYISGGGNLQAYDFRDKRRQDSGHAVSYIIDGQETIIGMDKDRFSRLYTRCLTLRPSCYACPYCSAYNCFDFTIGDFWGSGKYFPEFTDGKGVSLVIAHNMAASDLLEGIDRNEARIEPFEPESEDVLQAALQTPARQTLLRKLLFKDYGIKGTDGHCDMAMILKKYAAG